MKKNFLMLATFATSLLATAVVHADDPKPDNELTYNASVTSDYRYRGISQTRLEPALQGGADYTNNPTGLYAGTWLSSIKWIKDAGGDANVEWDVYGGKRGNFTEDFSYDVGFLSYIYVNNNLPVSANTTELYAQLGYGPAYIKYSQSVTNLFGFDNSKESGYVDAGANIELVKNLTLNLHAGHQEVKNTSAASYDDWKVGLTEDFGVVTGAIAVFGTNADKSVYSSAENGKFLGKDAVVVSITKTF